MPTRSAIEIIADLLEVLWYHEGARDAENERIQALEEEARQYIKNEDDRAA